MHTFGCPCCTHELSTREMMKMRCEECGELFDSQDVLLTFVDPDCADEPDYAEEYPKRRYVRA